MTFGLVVLAASTMVIFGVLLGWMFSQRQLEAGARRQVAAQLSLSRQLYELQAARQRTYPASPKRGNLARGSRRRAA